MSHSSPPQSHASSAVLGAARHPKPSARLTAVNAELSEIRRRPHFSHRASLPVGEQPGQLLAKVSRAESLLLTIGISNPRARLLQTAISRRDEALLDALMRDITCTLEADHRGNVG